MACDECSGYDLVRPCPCCGPDPLLCNDCDEPITEREADNAELVFKSTYALCTRCAERCAEIESAWRELEAKEEGHAQLPPLLGERDCDPGKVS